MNIPKPIAIPALLAVLGIGVTAVQAAPNGNPFVELEGQIVEVQGAVASLQEQIDALIGEVDTIEQRLAADAAAIVALEAEVMALSASIEANVGDIETLAAEVDHNIELIEALQNEMASIEAELALKQDLIDGRCPDGHALQEIREDGSVVCESVGTTTRVARVVNSDVVEGGWSGSVAAACPDGYTLSGGGFSSAGMTATGANPLLGSSTTWVVSAHNNRTYRQRIYAYAYCLRFGA